MSLNFCQSMEWISFCFLNVVTLFSYCETVNITCASVAIKLAPKDLYPFFLFLLTLTKGSYSIKMLATSGLNTVTYLDSCISTDEERKLTWTLQKS